MQAVQLLEHAFSKVESDDQVDEADGLSIDTLVPIGRECTAGGFGQDRGAGAALCEPVTGHRISFLLKQPCTPTDPVLRNPPQM